MSVSISVTETDATLGVITFKLSFYGESEAGDVFYIDVQNANSSYYYDFVKAELEYGAAEENTLTLRVTGVGRLFTGDNRTFRLRWNGSSSTTSPVIPIRYLESPYTIPERPMQQTQYVTYNGVSKGQAGSCVANATASSMEVLKMRTGNTVYAYSVGWIYGGAGDGVTEELQFNESFDFLKVNGSPPAQVMTNTYGMNSYPDVYFQPDAKVVYNQNRSSALQYATPQRLGSWRKINTDSDWNFEGIFNSIKREGSTVVITLNIDKSFDNASGTGWVAGINGSTRGGHCCIVLGWTRSNNKNYWILQNGWATSNGTPFGDNGLYYLPFDFYTFDGCGIWDFYELIRDENAPVMPTLPDNTGVPTLIRRDVDGFEIGCNIVAGATRYEFRARREDISTYITKISSTNNVLYTSLAQGYTYHLSVRFLKNGTWSPFSQESTCTVLPDYPTIETVYSTTPNNLIVKLKNGSMEGKYSYIETWRRNYPWNNSGSNLDKKVTYFVDDLVEWTGLTTGNKFSFSCVGCINVGTAILQSYFRSEEMSGTVGIVRPPYFTWDNPKVTGQPINVTASEWNRLAQHINVMLDYKGKSTSTFTSVKSGDMIRASIFNELRTPIISANGLSSDVSIPLPYANQTVITSNHFNKLVESVNSVS